MSIDISKPAAWHLEVARKLQKLREYQVLIVGSGNIVHNLGAINWSDSAEAHPSSVAFHKYIVEAIENNDIDAIANYTSHPDAAYAVPTPEHFLPLLYVLGARRPNEAPHTVTDGFVYSSLSMYSVAFG
jgi:4,5-DOPA dioxygenase extradiol